MSAKPKVSGSVVAGFPSLAEQYQEPLGLRLPSKADAFSADILDLNELLVKRPAATIRPIGGVTLLRTAMELRGVSCHEVMTVR